MYFTHHLADGRANLRLTETAKRQTFNFYYDAPSQLRLAVNKNNSLWSRELFNQS